MPKLEGLPVAQLILMRRDLQDEIDGGENTPMTEDGFRRQIKEISAELSRRPNPLP